MSKNEKKVASIKDFRDKKAEKQHKKQKNLMAGTVVILVITVISFVLVPAISGAGGGGGSLVFGKFGRIPIVFAQGNYFSKQVESINSMYRDSLGSEGNVDFLRQLIWRSAYNQTVVRTAVLDEMDRSEASISTRRIDRAIVESGMFNENGSFDEEAYMNTSGSRIKEIRSSLAEDLKVQVYYEDTLSNLQRSDRQLDFLLSMGTPEKNFSYARLAYSSYPESEIVKYGNENSKFFRRMSLNRITVRSSEKEARDILNKLESGESSFDDLARNFSKDSFAEDGGAMGSVDFYTLTSILSEEQADEIFSLASGSHSDVIVTESGFYIFRAAESAVAPDLSSSETLAQIRSYMEREEVGLIEDYLMAQAEALAAAAQNSTLETAALEAGIENGETGYIAAAYGNIPFIVNSAGNKKDNSLLSSLAYSDEFFETAYALKTAGTTTAPMVLDRSVVIFSLLDEREGFEYPEEYKDYIKAQLGNELSQYKQGQMQAVFLESDRFKDNFNSTYNRIFSES